MQRRPPTAAIAMAESGGTSTIDRRRSGLTDPHCPTVDRSGSGWVVSANATSRSLPDAPDQRLNQF